MSEIKKKKIQLTEDKKKEYIEILDKDHSAMMKLHYNLYFLIIPTIILVGVTFILLNLFNINYIKKIVLGIVVDGSIFYFIILKKIKKTFVELKVFSQKRKDILKKIRK